MPQKTQCPTHKTIASWHQKHPQPWHDTLFPGLDGKIWFLSNELEKSCWLTKSKNRRPKAIVPLELGGENHPSNYVLLNPGLFPKAPEEKTPKPFLQWLTEKATRRQERFKEAWKTEMAKSSLEEIFRMCEIIKILREKRIPAGSLAIQINPKKKKESGDAFFFRTIKAILAEITGEKDIEAAITRLQK